MERGGAKFGRARRDIGRVTGREGMGKVGNSVRQLGEIEGGKEGKKGRSPKEFHGGLAGGEFMLDGGVTTRSARSLSGGGDTWGEFCVRVTKAVREGNQRQG